MEVTTRQATANDTAFARAVHHAAYHEVVLHQFGAWEPARQDAFFEAEWAPNATELVLVDGAPCGYWVVEHRVDDIHVRELVLSPEHQGHGIGTTLLRRLQTAATMRGVPVRLGTFLLNPALSLYQRLGFRELGRDATHVLVEWLPTAGNGVEVPASTA